jgi:hypothetical protein
VTQMSPFDSHLAKRFATLSPPIDADLEASTLQRTTEARSVAQARRPRQRSAFMRQRFGPVVLIALTLVVVGTLVAAAVGRWRIFDLGRSGPRIEIARGVSAKGHEWQLIAYTSTKERGVCVQLESGGGSGVVGSCWNDVPDGRLLGELRSVTLAPGESQGILLWGPVAKAVARVRIELADGSVEQANIERRAGFSVNFVWLTLSGPARAKAAVAVDKQGNELDRQAVVVEGKPPAPSSFPQQPAGEPAGGPSP